MFILINAKDEQGEEGGDVYDLVVAALNHFEIRAVIEDVTNATNARLVKLMSEDPPE